MSSKFRLGIVGAGLITAQAHLPSALALPNVEVTALVDPEISRAESLARTFGAKPKVASSVGEVLKDIDGAIIATPNWTHRDLSLQCLKAGVHVLVEKPLAVSVAEGDDIVAAANQAGLVAAVGYVTRFYENFAFLEGLLAASHFGNVHRFHHQFGTAGGWAPMSGYTLDRKAIGGGVLVVTGTHFLDRMVALWGMPESVDYRDDSLGGPEANCFARLVFQRADGRIEGTVRYSKTTKLPGGLVIDTDAGLVVLEDTMSAQLVLRPRASPGVEMLVRPRSPSRRAGNAFIWQIEDFVAACVGRTRPRITAGDGLNSLRLVERMYAAKTLLDEPLYTEREAA